jgi:hypothetical protein
MKTFLAIIATLLLTAGSAISQIPDYSDFKSIVKVPGNYSFSPAGVNSTISTINGFDNFYLGTDFGEPYIATNPNDPKNSVCAFNMNSIYYTLDGVNWTKTSASFPGFAVIGDPVLAFDSLGNCLYAQLYQNSTYGIAVSKSTDKGVSWTVAYNVATPTSGLMDKEWICADQTAGPFSNNLYLGWRQFGSIGMRFVRSTNGGVNWSTPITFTGDQGAYVCVGANGSVSGGSVYMGCIYGSTIRVARSTNGGASFTAQEIAVSGISGPGVICSGRNTVKGCIRTDYFPRMAADNSFTSTRGYVYVAYAANPAGTDNADIFLARSTDYGLTWSTPVRVNDDATTTDQWMPTITVDKTGKIFISWYDSREDATNNLLTKVYGATSTNGGLTFTANYPISNTSFSPDNMKQSQGSGEAYYIGDYIGISPTNNVGYGVWMDGRNNSLGSYVGYYPDFALTSEPSTASLNNNDSVSVVLKIPEIKGPYSGRVKFTAALDSLPPSGNINLSFKNGKDSITSFPDSIILRIKTVGSVTSKLYNVIVYANGINGTPVHIRKIIIAVNSSYLNIGTNRESIVEFKVNGVSYTYRQQLLFPNGTNITAQAVSPQIIGPAKYVYLNWSNSGDTTQNFNINGALNLTANYKVQYKLILNSSVGNSFGGNLFYDSAANFQFGVYSKTFVSGGTTYYFRGWTGAGAGAYTSPDSTGNDTVKTWSISNAIVETARWTTWPNAITQISSEIPKVYNLYQNYPNPFNPETKIMYDIPKNGLVKIFVYDILGREVNSLVNSYHEAGKYETTFNSEGLSSGIYYYKIESGSFSSIKKMLIIK